MSCALTPMVEVCTSFVAPPSDATAMVTRVRVASIAEPTRRSDSHRQQPAEAAAKPVAEDRIIAPVESAAVAIEVSMEPVAAMPCYDGEAGRAGEEVCVSRGSFD